SEEAVGKPLSVVLPSIKKDPSFLTALRLAKEGRKSFLPAIKEEMHRRHLETHFIPLRKDDVIIGVMLLIHDVAHRIVKEEELQQLNEELQKKVRQLKHTSRELAHLTHIATYNVREPVRMIYSTVEWMIQTESKNMSNSGRASFRRIQSALNRMN